MKADRSDGVVLGETMLRSRQHQTGDHLANNKKDEFRFLLFMLNELASNMLQ